ncbi:hypothetical protein HAX54_024402 [Datura stramonium]|uniref:Uncharacterized protein n=1 Tax=Datura stramonium TaxID=4076 RepID=A0ABS8UZM2_DATST|nr:hypothetical protein [Datura stramonium]
MQGKATHNVPLWSGPSLDPAHRGSFSAPGCTLPELVDSVHRIKSTRWSLSEKKVETHGPKLGKKKKGLMARRLNKSTDTSAISVRDPANYRGILAGMCNSIPRWNVSIGHSTLGLE